MRREHSQSLTDNCQDGREQCTKVAQNLPEAGKGYGFGSACVVGICTSSSSPEGLAGWCWIIGPCHLTQRFWSIISTSERGILCGVLTGVQVLCQTHAAGDQQSLVWAACVPWPKRNPALQCPNCICLPGMISSVCPRRGRLGFDHLQRVLVCALCSHSEAACINMPEQSCGSCASLDGCLAHAVG